MAGAKKQVIAGTRREERLILDLASVASDKTTKVNCLIHDITVDGALIKFNTEERPFEEGARINLTLPEFGPCYGTIRWYGARKAGVAFTLATDERRMLRNILDGLI
ncbi:PilZ domain-containing protein [Tropicibacter sp. R15_0]|uniref:PilZ domain-containing protein n=1 Tax=Tropicibacter sp. R15_0 TaxID=2821101 RepID=UPI001ADC8227|nr:PilZ domain-containing protein [Tropicibacter sp. R15_0]MBO9465010.1 PilZ domain-containing protein [Tropicibacter sp. R15_0]